MKTVLFYSFKGGVGRTQTLLNSAKYLSEVKNKKIAIVDFDIYAPGLSYLSNNQKNNDEEYFLKYLVNLFQDETTKQIVSEKLSENLTLIPAFNMQNIKPYHNLLTQLSEYLYSIKQNASSEVDSLSTVADNIFEVIKEDIAKTGEYDYIFFDARTGLTEVSDILFSQYVDLKVIVSSYNDQNINGTNAILDILPATKIEKHKIVRVLSPKPKKSRDEFIGIKARANLDDNLKLKNKFEWFGTYEIPYEDEIVINDFKSWENLQDNKNDYRDKIITVANTIDDIFMETLI